MKHFICSVASDTDAAVIEGDDETELFFPEIDSPCEISPVGQCEYSIFDPDICIHCRKATGA